MLRLFTSLLKIIRWPFQIKFIVNTLKEDRKKGVNRKSNFFDKKKLETIKIINSKDNYAKLNYVNELVQISDLYIKSNSNNLTYSTKILDCIQQIRTIRFIEDTGQDHVLLKRLLLIIKHKVHDKTKLYVLSQLKSALYYSNYYPKEFNKAKIEKSIKKIMDNNG